MTIRSQDLTWITDTTVDGAVWRFNQTFETDFASAIPGTSPRHFEVTDVSASGADVVVRFRIKQECGIIATDGEAIADNFGRRLLQEQSIVFIGVVPPVANITESIRLQLADSSSDLYRGVITSSASGEFSVEDPAGIAGQSGSGSQPPITHTTPKTAIADMLPLWGWIAASMGAFLLITLLIVFCCVRKRKAAASAQKKMKEVATEPAKSPTASMSPTSSTEAPLPEGWTQQTAPDGQIYYYNTATGVSEWVRPTAASAASR
jgi:hypothetical protein